MLSVLRTEIWVLQPSSLAAVVAGAQAGGISCSGIILDSAALAVTPCAALGWTPGCFAQCPEELISVHVCVRDGITDVPYLVWNPLSQGQVLQCIVPTLDTKGGGGKGPHHACFPRDGLHGISGSLVSAAEHLRGSHFSLSGSPVNACHLGRNSYHPVTAVPRQRSHVACPRLCPPLSQHTGVLTEGAV